MRIVFAGGTRGMGEERRRRRKRKRKKNEREENSFTRERNCE